MKRSLEVPALAAIVLAAVAVPLRRLDVETDYDEGVYLASLHALRAGQELGTDVFAPQPPGFYALLRVAGALAGTEVRDVRVAFVLLAAVGLVGAWAVARAVAGPGWALLAPALLAAAPTLPLFEARVLADLPSLWLAAGASGLAAAGRIAGRGPPWAWAAAAGALLGLAVSVKLAAVTAAVVVVGLPLARRAWRELAATLAAGALVGATFLVVHADAVGELWESVVVYHRDARDTPAVVDRSEEILDELLNPRTPFVWLAAAALGVAVARALLRRLTLLEGLVWAWAAAGWLLVLTHAPLHPNHLVYVPVPLAIAAGTTLGAELSRGGRARLAAAALVALAVLAGHAQQVRRAGTDRPPEEASNVELAAALAAVTGRTELVASDRPIVPVLAERVVAGPLVDIPVLRFETGSLTDASFLRLVDERCVRAVVAGRALRDRRAALAGLAERFSRRARVAGADLFSEPRAPCPRAE